MSRLIEQLRASDFPDKTPRDLTLEYGQWLEGNGRKDIFLANPDFAQEYETIKDEIARARRPSYGEELKGSIGSAFDSLQESGFGVLALAAHGAKSIGIPGAEPIRNNLLRLMKEQEAQAAEFQPSVPSYENITNADDLGRYVTYGLGTMIPSAVQSAVAAGVGAGVGALAGGGAGTVAAPGPGTVAGAAGGAIGGAILGLAEKRLAQKVLSSWLAKGIKGESLEVAAKTLTKQEIAQEAKRLAVEYGSKTAIGISSVGQSMGGIYADNPDAPWSAVGYGIPAGLLDVLPETYIAGRFLGAGKRFPEDEAKKAVGYFRRFATEAAKVVPMEGTTEAAQTLLEIAAAKSGRGEDPWTFTDDDYKHMLNAGILGGIGGFGMAPASALANPDARPAPFTSRIPPMGFGGSEFAASEDYTQPVENIAAIPPQVVADEQYGLAQELSPTGDESDPFQPPQPARRSAEVFMANEEDPSLERGVLYDAGGGARGVTPQPQAPAAPAVELPTTVRNAVDNVNEAVRAVAAAQIGIEPPLVTLPSGVAEAESNAALLGNEVMEEQAFAVGAQNARQAQSGATQSAEALRAQQAADQFQEQAAFESGVATAEAASKMPIPVVEAPPPVTQAPAAPVHAPVAQVAASAAPTEAVVTAPVPVPVIQPTGVVTQPTAEQVIARGENGVKPLPRESAPNLKRLQVFEQPRPAARVEGQENEPLSIQPIEAGALGPNPMVELAKRVKKATKADSNVVVVIVDNQTGQAFQRLAYGGPSNTVNLDMASRREPNKKSYGTIQGSTTSQTADFVNGTEGRPISGQHGIFAETMPNGMPRYTVYGIGELSKPGKLANWNLGPVAGLSAHPGINEAAKRGWTEQAQAVNSSKDEMPRVPKFTRASEDAGNVIVAFQDEMSAWVVRHDNAAGRAAAAKRIDEFGDALAATFSNPKQGKAFADSMKAAIREKTKVAIAQTQRISADYTVPPAGVVDLFRSTLRALTEGRRVDVAAFEQGLFGALDSAAQTTGVVITPEARRPIVAFAASALNGPVDPATIISLLHEVAHIITAGLSEPLRVAFLEAVERMSWRSAPDGMGRWLMNPRSLDIRLLANADLSQLSPEQRRALELLTVEEIAAARRIDPTVLLEEQGVEHLAQLGWDKSEAKGIVSALVRFVKELWLRMAIAIQTALKGPKNLSPALARAYVENRFLQFINRDSALARDRINDLMNWLGVPATEAQKIPVFPAGADWDQRMSYIDVATGEIIPVKTGNYTPDAQAREVKLALDRAAKWIADNPPGTTPDTAELRFTRRATFSAPFSSTPSITLNKQFAQINLEDELYRTIAADSTIKPLLPIRDGEIIGPQAFAVEWLKLPAEQTPEARKKSAVASAGQPDPLTGAPIEHQPDITVDALPTVEQRITDREGRPKVVQITEAQDDAIKQAILSLRDTHRRVAATLARETERFDQLTRDRDRAARTDPTKFPSYDQYELSALGESVLLRQRIILRLDTEINRLYAKLDPADIVKIFPGAELWSVPDENATEAQIRGNRKYRIPLDLTFANKDVISDLGAEITRGEAWLKNPANRDQGQIYGIISEQVRKLRQIPLNQQRSAVSAILRKITGGFIDQLNASGLPSMRLMAKRFAGATAFINQYRSDAETLGRRWSTAFGQFAEAMGRPNDGAFVEDIWDPLSRVWNFIDSSERAKLGTPDEASIFEVVERAFRNSTGMKIEGEKQRAALRALTMQTIEAERFFGQIFDQHPELKVKDSELGVYRRLLTHGIVTGRRGLRREMFSLAQRMNPLWSDTTSIGPDDVRTFWEAAPDLYRNDRAAFDARMGELMNGYVAEDFVTPLALNNTPLFTVAASDGTSRAANLINVRQAWEESKGDVTKFAEILHQLEGAPDGMEAQTVGFVLGNLHERFERLKGIIDKQKAADNIGVETLQRQMLDGREANDLPAQWVSYATMDADSNLTLVHQLAMQAAFGPDALAPAKSSAFGDRVSATGADMLAAGGELAESVYAAKRELTAIRGRYDVLERDGLSPDQIKAAMGDDDFLIARNSAQSMANLDYVEANFRQLHSVTNYLNTDLKVASNVVGLMSTGMLQNIRSALQQLADMLGPIVDLKLSTQTLRVLRTDIKSAAAQIGNSVFEAFGQQAVFAVQAARRRQRTGSNRDSETRVGWREKTQGLGPRNLLGTPKGYEGKGSLITRTVSRVTRRARDIAPNIGSPFAEPGDERLGPKLTAGVFHTMTQVAQTANVDAAYDLFADIGTRGVEYLQAIPATERAQFVRELELGVRDLSSENLGFYGGFILNDKAAFESLKAALETQMSGERSVGDFVAKAYRRMEAAQAEAAAGEGDGSWEVISDSQFVDIANYANTQWTLQPDFATLPAFMQGPWRPLWIFLTWPYLAMRRAARGFTDSQQRMIWAGANGSVADGLKALFVVAAPATIAGSFAIDWYDEYILGKKQNLKSAPASTAIPVVGAFLNPEAFIERWARYGTAGFPSDLLNMAVNYDSQRGLSLDNRIVAVNAIGSLFNAAIKTPIQTDWNLTYASFGRPILQSIGGGGVLQYLQVAQNLLGLNTQDAAINARINTGNYLRAAGRELDLPVAVFAGPSAVPTPISPYLQQMELAALVNNPALFREAYRNAVQAARDEKKENPEQYVANNFVERHPLKRLFKGAVSETDYRKMLGVMGDYGATQVRGAINNYNRVLNTWFSKKAYYGRVAKDSDSVEELIRKATRINSEVDNSQSLLAVP